MVNIFQQHQTLISPSMVLHYAARGRKARRQKQLKQRQQLFISNPTLSFPKSFPTPLLINFKPYPQTKLQALDAVIKDLERSFQNGVAIELEIISSLLETCYRLNSIEHGIRIHRLLPVSVLAKNTGIASKLLRLYASCGYMEEAHQLFDQMFKRDESAFTWNSLIAGYAELGLYEDALALYFQMEEEGVEPDRFTFPRVLKACSGIGSVQIGEAVHRDVVRLGFVNDGLVLNALVNMYAKCGDIVKARRVFDMIDSKDSISYNSMLTAYVRHGLLVKALQTFSRMIQVRVEVDSVAISTILANMSSSLKLVTQIHGRIIRRGLEWDLSTVNSLIVCYSNSGKLDRAQWLFDHMPEMDVVSWNSIIASHCKSRRVITYFDRMERDGVMPDKVTFVSILSSCAHLGLVSDGERLFSLMRERYGIKPIMEHYACMVNLYGRAGFISKAYSIIIDEMEFEAGPTVWGALLYGCYLHGNVDVGEIAAQNLFELEPDNEHNFELLMKIYGKANRLEDVERVRTMMIDRGLELPYAELNKNDCLSQATLKDCKS